MINEIIRLLEHFRYTLTWVLTIAYFVAFSSIIISIIMNFKIFKKHFKDIKKFSWALLILFFILAIMIRTWTPRFIVTYYDELVSVEVAKNILDYGRVEMCGYRDYQKRDCSLFNEAGGFMFILAISHLIFGFGENVAVGASIFFGSLLVFVLFLFLYTLLKNGKIALYTAFLISISPLYILLSNSIEPDIISIFFGISSLLAFLLFIEEKKLRTLFLFLSLLSFFIQIKNENVIILFPLIIFVFASRTIKLFKKPRYFLLVLFFAILLVPHILHTFLEMYGSILLKQPTATAPSGILFDLGKILENIWIFRDEFRGAYYPFIINLFVILGALNFLNHKKEIGLLLLIFLVFSTLYLSYSAGIVDKYILMSTTSLMSLAGIGLWNFEEFVAKLFKNRQLLFFVMIIIITLFSLPYFNKLKYEPKPFVSQGYPRDEVFYKENEIVELVNKKINHKCFVVTENPNVFVFTKMLPIKTEAALENPLIIEEILERTNCVFYFEDLFCTDFYSFGDRCGLNDNLDDKCEDLRKKNVLRCQKMHEKYNLKLRVSFPFTVNERVKRYYHQQSSNITFNLYDISLKSDSRVLV